MSVDKYPSIFSRQMATIVDLYHALEIWYAKAWFWNGFIPSLVYFSIFRGRF